MQNPHQDLYSESALPSASELPPLPLPPTLDAGNPATLASATPLPPTPLAKDGNSMVTSPSPRSPQDNRPATPEYYFSQGYRSMPGTYSPVMDPRTQSPSTAVPYTTTTATTGTSPSSRRLSGHSFKNFLSGFRRSSGKESPQPRNSTDTSLSGSTGYVAGGGAFNDGLIQRPSTPGGVSMADSGTRPSLKSKMSGAFGRRRKSSLSNVLNPEDPAGGSQYTSSPRSVGTDFNSNHGTGSYENGIDNDSSSSSIFKLRPKPSLTFWNRRKSSLRTELEPTTSAQEPPQPSQRDTLTSSPSGSNKRARDSTDDLDALSSMSPPPTLRKRQSGSFWRRRSDLNKALNDQILRTSNGGGPQITKPAATRMDLDDEGEEYLPEEPTAVSRTPSPPPVLPELKLGGGLWGGDSGMFMDEGVFERIK